MRTIPLVLALFLLAGCVTPGSPDDPGGADGQKQDSQERELASPTLSPPGDAWPEPADLRGDPSLGVACRMLVPVQGLVANQTNEIEFKVHAGPNHERFTGARVEAFFASIPPQDAKFNLTGPLTSHRVNLTDFGPERIALKLHLDQPSGLPSIECGRWTPTIGTSTDPGWSNDRQAGPDCRMQGDFSPWSMGDDRTFTLELATSSAQPERVTIRTTGNLSIVETAGTGIVGTDGMASQDAAVEPTGPGLGAIEIRYQWSSNGETDDAHCRWFVFQIT